MESRNLLLQSQIKLSPQQRQFIKDSIGHLLDFDDSQSLTVSLEQIKQAFNNQITQKQKEKHPFYTLQECLNSPGEFLQGLERQYPLMQFLEVKESKTIETKAAIPITIGKVQECILSLVTKKIIETAEKHQHLDSIKTSETKSDFNAKMRKKSKETEVLQKLGWDREYFLKKIRSSPQYNKNFESGEVDYDSNLSVAPVQVLPDRIFSNRLFMVPVRRNIFFKTETVITLPEKHISNTAVLEVGANIFEDEDERNESLQELAPIAELAGIQQSSEHALRFLVSKKIISEEEAKKKSEASRHVLAVSFYFNLVLSGEILFSSISSVNYKEATALTSPVIINFLKEKMCSISLAKRIPPNIVENPFYNNKINLHELELENLTDLTDVQCRNLLAPNIIHLIDKKKITFDQAKEMTAGCCKFLENETNFDLFYNNQINWESIRKLTQLQTETLLNPEIIRLINEKEINIKDILTIKNNLILHLIANNILKISELPKIISSEIATSISKEQLPVEYTDDKIVKYRKYINEFLTLSSQGLVVEEDLLILFNNIDNLIQNETKANNQLSSSLLQRCQPLLNEALINVCIRIDAIHQKKPILLPNGKIDNLRLIFSQLEKFHIYSDEIWMQIFDLRLLGFLHEIPHRSNNGSDPLHILNWESSRMLGGLQSCRTAGSPALINQIQQKIIKHFIKQLLGDLEHEKDLGNNELKIIHKKIAEEFSIAQKLENEHVSIYPIGDSIWKPAFNHIAQFAAQFVSTKKQRSCCRWFFYPPSTLLKDYCDKLCEIAKQLNDFNFSLEDVNDKSMSLS